MDINVDVLLLCPIHVAANGFIMFSPAQQRRTKVVQHAFINTAVERDRNDR